ncbi:MAG: peptide-methionine (R)-S-oxide reductase MsrB [Paludisphaera borealis]|uniref:peptide-methionine (R)-S-oxide reductase MsrB n=1 Tax=Paludisphaera borealis TaxID=1387353 RepID=UPI0028451535|nr:peptide-methionine (R)-S-oxide reductase MsrB [Paludisphaera borealis]MDR3618130.1 peptide-methionine (R)-S-oxide reductase MsrB [Paludisphaera borealis]
MNLNMTMSRSMRFALVALACGLATWFHPALAVAQDAEPTDKPKASANDDKGRSDSKKTDSKTSDAKESAEAEPEHVYKTDEEWRKLLTYEQYMVTRMKATEPAFSGKYAHGHPKGTFLCVCCGAKLFDSRHKFESGTGWPSFWRPITIKALDETLDQSEIEPRVEVTCARCGAHIGHVFQDGPPPTGLRYCTNSLSLKLDSEPVKPTTSNKTSSRGVRKRTTPSTKSASKSSKSSAEHGPGSTSGGGAS